MRNIGILVCVFFFCLVQTSWAQEQGTHKNQIVTFDAPGAGTSAGQGTQGPGINPAGAITGFYLDNNSVNHGFLRDADGKITTLDAPGAGTGAGQGTLIWSINPGGAIPGYYFDGSNVAHGFLRARDGTLTIFDVPGAGTNAGQGTIAGNINPGGVIAGSYVDANGVNHGFVRASNGTITTFDVPGAGTGAGQGTIPELASCLNPAGAVTGLYVDGSNVIHGFVRAPDGTITKIDVPGAGTGAFQGTFGGGGGGHRRVRRPGRSGTWVRACR